MVDLILVIALMREECRERQCRIVGVRITPLRGDGALHVDEDESVRLGLVDAGIEARIRLSEYGRVESRVLPHPVPLDVEPEQRLQVFLDIQNRLVVVGPRDVRFHIDDGVFEHPAARQMPEAQLVLAASDEILANGGPFGIRRDLDRAYLIVILSRGAPGRRPFVAVQYDLLGRIPRAPVAHHDGMFLARLEPGDIPVAVLEIRDARIVLFQACDDFGVQLLPERLGSGEGPLLVRVLGVQVGQHLGILPFIVPQPVIGVDPLAVRRCDGMGPNGGLWRLILMHVSILSSDGAGV